MSNSDSFTFGENKLNDVAVHNKVHKASDVDSGSDSQHHTLGKGINQAASGNHKHEDIIVKGTQAAANIVFCAIPRTSGYLRINATSYLGGRIDTVPILRRATNDIYIAGTLVHGEEGQSPYLTAVVVDSLSTSSMVIKATFNSNGAANSDVFIYWRFEGIG